MVKKSAVSDVLKNVIEQLDSLDTEERSRVIRAIQVYFGQSAAPASGDAYVGEGDGAALKRPPSGAAAFFDRKQPKTKLEELAVAAKYREEAESAETSSQEQLKAIFDSARRHFDSKNFRRDIENARGRGLFLRAAARNEFKLSSVGQKMVDALPNRSATEELGGGRKRARGKRKG